MEKQLSENQEQDNQEKELDAEVDKFGNIILSVPEGEIRARIDQLRNTETSDSGE